MGGTRGSGIVSSVDAVWCVGERIGFMFYQYFGNMVSVGRVSVLGFPRRWWYQGVCGARLGPGSERGLWCYVCVCYESVLFVYMAGPDICILC